MWPSHLILLDQGRSVGSGIAVTPLISRCTFNDVQRFPLGGPRTWMLSPDAVNFASNWPNAAANFLHLCAWPQR